MTDYADDVTDLTDLTAAERERLHAAWPAPEVPADFADRVAASWAREATADPVPELAAVSADSAGAIEPPAMGSPRAWTRWGRVAAVSALAAVAAGGVAVSNGWVTVPGFGGDESVDAAGDARDEGVVVTPTSDEARDADDETDAPNTSTGGATTSIHPPLPVALEHDIRTYLGSYGRHYGEAFRFSGVVLVARGDEVVEVGLGSRGVSRPDVPSRATVFRIGALTQPMIATAVARVGLDTESTIGACVPNLPEPWRDVTLARLLEHRSGIPNFTDDMGHHLRRAEVHEPAQLWEYVARHEMGDGSELDPSNTNYALLGACLEKHTGKSLDLVLGEQVFEPAGMQHARYGLGSSAHVADGTTFDEDEVRVASPRVAPSAWAGAGGISASADDLLAFHRALRDERLLSADQQLSLYAGPDDAPAREGISGYGRGWTTTRVDGDFEVGHPGGLDGFNAQLTRRLADDTLVVVLVNSDTLDARAVAETTLKLVDGERVEPVFERQERPIPDDAYQRYLGTYRLSARSRARYEKVVDAGRLDRMNEVQILWQRDRAWMYIPAHGITWMHPFAEHQFFFKDDAGTTARFGFSGDDEHAAWLTLRAGEVEFVLRRAEPAP